MVYLMVIKSDYYAKGKAESSLMRGSADISSQRYHYLKGEILADNKAVCTISGSYTAR